MFSERLKLARKRSGFSLRDLSLHVDGMVSAQAIGKYERGEMMPSSSVAIGLAGALGVSATYLLSPSVVSLESVEFRKLASPEHANVRWWKRRFLTMWTVTSKWKSSWTSPAANGKCPVVPHTTRKPWRMVS